MKTEIITDAASLPRAAEAILAGALCAVPTETVYGLSANGLDPAAVARIYEVKGRPETKPISLLVSGERSLPLFCRDIPARAYLLAEAFWPGPLTMILKRNSRVPDIVTAGGDTVGVRCPDHPLTLELLRLCGVPLATPSANISGMPSPKDASGVLGYFDGRIECLIDGGRCRVSVESTIVDLTRRQPRILRPGGLPAEAVENVLHCEVLR